MNPAEPPTAPLPRRTRLRQRRRPHGPPGRLRRLPVRGPWRPPWPDARAAGTGPLIAMSKRAPVSTAEAAAHSNARAGYRSPRASRGLATRIRKRRRSATSLAVRGSVGEPSCPSAEGMGDGVWAGTVSLGSHGSRQPHGHQHRACPALRSPLTHNGHDITSLTRPANRTNPNHAMPLVPRPPHRQMPRRNRTIPHPNDFTSSSSVVGV